MQLKVTGFIRTDVTFEPAEVAFGEFAGGEVRSRKSSSLTGNPQWSITDVRSHCQHLKVRLNPPERSGGQVRYRMFVQTKPSMPEGMIQERLTLISNDRAFSTTEMMIEGQHE